MAASICLRRAQCSRDDGWKKRERMIEFFYRTVLSGAGATSLLDLWALFLQRFFRVPAPNWGLVGRWFCPLTKARVIHDDITPAHPYPFARVVGWIGHYAIGIVYAGLSWRWPTLAPALAVGIITPGPDGFCLWP